MYIGKYFYQDLNFEDLGALKAIHSVQVHVKNNILFDENKGVVGISILYI